MENQSEIFQTGDNIKISPINDTEKLFYVNAEVEKVSAVKKLVFVKFILLTK